MTASSVPVVLNPDTSPDWVQADKEMIYAEGETFALAIPQDMQEKTYILLVPAEGYKSVDLGDDESYEMRTMPMEGQRTRIQTLRSALQEQDWSEAARAIGSLTTFEAAQLQTDVWSYTVDTDTPPEFRRRGRGHDFTKVETLDFMRRFCFAADQLEHRLVKLGDGPEDEIRRQINEALDVNGEVGAEDVGSLSVRQDEGMSRAIRDLLAHYEEQGLVLAGGSPDSGIMLFVEPSALEGVTEAESAQRAGKIFLRGGRALDEGKNTRARLVDFESGDYGHRDGIFAVMANDYAADLARRSGVEAGWSYQGQYIDIGTALMKGMVYVAGEDAPAWDLRKVLHHAQHGAPEVEVAIDLNIWNKVIDNGAEEGDIVEFDPSKLWVMESDVRSNLSSVSISPQLIERAGQKITDWLAGEMLGRFEDFAETVHSGDNLGDYVSPFGRLGKMAERGLDFFKSDREDVAEELSDELASFCRNGARTQGTPVRLFHDDDLSVDMGGQVPGARVPESWGLDVGDHFFFVAYPALPALDEADRNTCIFTCEVEETSPAPHVYLHGDVALNALRDEDGDKPVCIVPESQEDVPVVGQADIGLTTVLEDAVNTKAELFEADVTSENVFEVYSRLGAQVGRADNLVTSTMLYLGDDLKSVETPTGEAPTVFMSKAIQASIESMKHVTDESYSLGALRQWTKEVVPEAWEEDESGQNRFNHHPALNVRKPGDGGGETTIDQHVDALGELATADTPDGVWAETLQVLMKATPLATIDGDRKVFLDEDHFVGESHYEDAAWRLFEAIEAQLFDDPALIDKVGALAQKVWDDAKEAGDKAAGDRDLSESQEARLAYHKAQVRHLKVAGLKLRMQLTEAEFAIIAAYAALKYADGTEGSGRMKMALAVCPPVHLETMHAIGQGEISEDEEILDALGLDGRNAITSNLEDKIEHLGRADRMASQSAGKQVLVKPREDGQRLEAGDLVTAGKPGTTVRKLTDENGGEFWLQDGSQGELPPARQFRVRDTAGYAVTLVAAQ